MSRAIDPIRDVGDLAPRTVTRAPEAGFGEALRAAFESAGETERAAERATAGFVAGEVGIHEAMIAAEKAAIALRYATTVKNRAVEAYRELMNTPV